MKIKAHKDLHITTTWGAAIFLKVGEVREVGDDLAFIEVDVAEKE